MSSSSPTFSVKATKLEEKLTEEEATIVRVFRQCGPSVAFVTSYSYTARSRSRFRSRTRSKSSRSKSSTTDPNTNPKGTQLGSGSGFVIEQDGYLITNYHVVQRAYELQKAFQQLKNVTSIPFQENSKLPKSLTVTQSILSYYFNATSNILGLGLTDNSFSPTQVYVRINSATKYQKAEIVGVKPELDLAVLKINEADDETVSVVSDDETDMSNLPSYPCIQPGSSADLLVGQRVVAIGNPFGLDQSVTAGVVSATNRDYTGVAGNKIPNCIQTDAAINPGNSGGPLLNSQGQFIGVNTAIITTSGSNAGIGFAIPSDAVLRATNSIVDIDRRRRVADRLGHYGRKDDRGYLGVTLASDELTNSLWKKSKLETKNCGVLVLDVKKDCSGEKGGLIPTTMENGKILQRGDIIVALNGKEIEGGVKEVQDDFRRRKLQENITLTVEGNDGIRRVVYVTLTDYA